MLIWAIVALSVAVGAPAAVVGATALVAVHPVAGTSTLVGLAVASRLRRRRRDPGDEVAFLREVTATVASGTTLRAAVRDGDRAVVGETTRRLCDAGMPMAAVGASLRDALPTNGEAFAAVCDLSEETGSSLVPTLFTLTERARTAEEIARRRRVATAQARFSALVVGVAPLVVTAGLLTVRGLPDGGGPFVVVPILAGATLQIAGVVIVAVMAARYA